MKKIVTFSLAFFIFTFSFAQLSKPDSEYFNYHTKIQKNSPLNNLWEEHTVPPFRTCGTPEYYEMQIVADPERAIYLERAEAEIQKWIKNNKEQLNNGKTLITIPIVVHVVYNTSAQNISDAQILSQINILNQDFRNTNPDGSTVPSVFQSLRADAEIEFCLATVDPQGNPTTGITRTQTSVTAFSIQNDAVKYSAQGGKDIWDRNNYLNIWVCNLQGGLLGYAQFPGGPPSSDGVVVTYRAFGDIGTAQAPYDKGRTATHEIGHWLHLYHIWGDDGPGQCTGTDHCNDTPNQADPYFGCPSHPQSSCGSTDMFMNYMDYVNDACMVMFTPDQKARMVAALNGPRSSILTSAACGASGANPNADFTANVTTVPEGGTVHFTDLSTNNPSTWSWSFSGGTPATSTQQNPAGIIYNTAGTYDVSLTATNVHGSDTETKTDYITVVAGSLPPVADFTANMTTISEGGSVNFTDLSANLPTSWSWTFTGGTPATSTQQNPTGIIYNTAGTYEVSLTVENSEGVDTETKTGYITVVAGAAPVADFYGNPTTINVGGSVNFTDQSANYPTSWEWSFPGGNPPTSTQQNPTGVTYGAAGIFPVTLAVSNAHGNDSVTKTAYITVSDGVSGNCDTLSLPLNGTLALYESPAGHYATGTNEFNDKAKAQFFDDFAPYYRLMGGAFRFGAATGSNSDVTFAVWDNSGQGGKPGTSPLTTKDIPIENIVTQVNNQQLTYVFFDAPIVMHSSFYLGFKVPQNYGDTLALVSNSSGQGGSPVKAWEQWANDDWYDFSVAWSGNLDVKLCVFPIICKTTSIDDPDPLNMVIYPNPANDYLVIDFINSFPCYLNLNIFNAMGALVHTVCENNPDLNKYKIDLNNFNAGLYYLTVETNKGTHTHKFTIIR